MKKSQLVKIIKEEIQYIKESKIAEAIQDAIELWYNGYIKKADKILSQLTGIPGSVIDGILLRSNVNDAMEDLMKYEKVNNK